MQTKRSLETQGRGRKEGTGPSVADVAWPIQCLRERLLTTLLQLANTQILHTLQQQEQQRAAIQLSNMQFRSLTTPKGQHILEVKGSQCQEQQ